jgi:hypothetical protein
MVTVPFNPTPWVKLALTPAGSPVTDAEVAPTVLNEILAMATPRQTVCESFAGLVIVIVGRMVNNPPMVFKDELVHPPMPVTK